MAENDPASLNKMSDFTKAKIGFAVALLAALFTIHPVIAGATAFSFPIFGFQVPLSWFYYSTMSSLCLSVYFYALAFLRDKTLTFFEALGNYLYALSLFIPIGYMIIAVVAGIAYLISQIKPELGNFAQLTTIVNSIVALASVIVSLLTSRVLNRRDKQSLISALGREESSILGHASAKIQSQDYNGAVLQAFMAVELALRKALLKKGIEVDSNRALQIIDLAAQAELLNQRERDELHIVRKLRNQVAHNPQPISLEKAEGALNTVKEVLRRLNPDEDE